MISKCTDQAGPKIAPILSLVESCRRLKVPVREYRECLAAVLPGRGDLPITRIPRRTPDEWARGRGMREL
jgi:transposase